MSEQFDLISLGDANIDVFISPLDSETLCEVDTKRCLIGFSYGDKIPTKSLEFSIGGNGANNVIGAKRLGVMSAPVLSIGEDHVGVQIKEVLEKEGIDTRFVKIQAGTVSNYNTVINYSGERTIFTYHALRTYDFPADLPSSNWAYLTSMGENFKPFYDQTLVWLSKNPNTKLAFNPGSWQFRNLENIKEVLTKTHVVFINRQEAEKISEFGNSHQKEKELLQAVTKLGPKIVVITDGGGGSFVTDGAKFIKCGVLPIDAYERTGAGDAFGSGALSAIIKGKTLEEALLWGTVNSASVIGYTGSQKGLLRDSEMPAWLDRARSSGVKVEEF